MFTKTQIDRLGNRLRQGNVSEADLRLLDSYRRSFAPVYEHVIATIREAVHYPPTGRPAKSTTSIVEKLLRESIRLTQMQDIAGCRLVVPHIGTQNRIVKLLVKELSAEVSDRRKHPSHGYRAVHLIAKADDKQIEVQVRTRLQHLWAEFSEKLSDVIDPSIKYGGGPPSLRGILDQLSKTVGDTEELELERITVAQRKQLRRVKMELRQLMKKATIDVSRFVEGN